MTLAPPSETVATYVDSSSLKIKCNDLLKIYLLVY